MQRNWDVLRKILLKAEALPTEDSALDSHELDGTDPQQAAYHMRLLIEGGLAVGGCRSALGPPWCHLTRLTWAGHELLDSIRAETVWNKVKKAAREKGLDLSLSVVKGLAKAAIEQLL